MFENNRFFFQLWSLVNSLSLLSLVNGVAFLIRGLLCYYSCPVFSFCLLASCFLPLFTLIKLKKVRQIKHWKNKTHNPKKGGRVESRNEKKGTSRAKLSSFFQNSVSQLSVLRKIPQYEKVTYAFCITPELQKMGAMTVKY